MQAPRVISQLRINNIQSKETRLKLRFASEFSKEKLQAWMVKQWFSYYLSRKQKQYNSNKSMLYRCEGLMYKAVQGLKQNVLKH